MSFQRKLARNVVRKQVGNKGVRGVWREFQLKQIKSYVESLDTDANKDNIVKILFKKLLKKVATATKKKRRRV